MSKDVEYAIHNLLSGLAGGRVYALKAPQTAVAPFIIFQRTTGERWRSINAPSGLADVTMQIDCYAEDFYSMRDLANQVENILDGYRNTVYYGSGSPQASIRIAGCTLQNETDILDESDEPFLFRNTADYKIIFER